MQWSRGMGEEHLRAPEVMARAGWRSGDDSTVNRVNCCANRDQVIGFGKLTADFSESSLNLLEGTAYRKANEEVSRRRGHLLLPRSSLETRKRQL